jgi:hypothetical protein
MPAAEYGGGWCFKMGSMALLLGVRVTLMEVRDFRRIVRGVGGMVGHLPRQLELIVNDLGATRTGELWHEHRYDTESELSAQNWDGPEMMRVLKSAWTGAGIESTFWFGNDSLLHWNQIRREPPSNPTGVSRSATRDYADGSSAPVGYRSPRRPILPPPDAAPCGDWIVCSIGRVRWIPGKNRMRRRGRRTVLRAPWEPFRP